MSLLGDICSIVGAIIGIIAFAFAIYTYIKSKDKKK